VSQQRTLRERLAVRQKVARREASAYGQVRSNPNALVQPAPTPRPCRWFQCRQTIKRFVPSVLGQTLIGGKGSV